MTTKDEALQMALVALEEIHPGNMTPMAEKALDTAIAALREALAQKDEQEPVAWKRRLVEIHDALSYELGDTDPHIEDDMTDEEVREEMPVFWAAKEVAKLMDEAPWDSLPLPRPKLQPLTDEGINEIAESMPGSLAGFMKGWGWQQFARAIEAAHGIGAEHDAW